MIFFLVAFMTTHKTNSSKYLIEYYQDAFLMNNLIELIEI